MKVFVVFVHVDESTFLKKVFDSFEKAEQFVFRRFTPTHRERFYEDEKHGIFAEIREMEVE